MNILAIDPGNEKSAYVVYDTSLTDLQDIRESKNVKDFGIFQNEDMLSIIHNAYAHHLAIEMIASYGMPVGATVFETCVWIGRFIQKWDEIGGRDTTRIYRKEVCLHLCHSARAKDSNVRCALLDRYPATGGGKTPQVGTKKQPGPLYGVSKDVWAALGVAITYVETKL